MWQLLKTLFGKQETKQTLSKTVNDVTFGILINEYEEEDTSFSWFAEVDKFKKNEDDDPMSIYIDGTIDKPFPEALAKAHFLIDRVPDLFYQVQRELDWKFAKKKVNLSKDYYLEDISVYYDQDEREVTYDLEFFTVNNGDMISVEFVNDKIEVIEFY